MCVGGNLSYNNLESMLCRHAFCSLNSPSAYRHSVNNPIAVQGYSGGSKKYERVVVISKDGPAWFDFNFTNIDELRLFSLSTGNAHFVIDDFSYIRLRKAMPWIPLLLLDD